MKIIAPLAAALLMTASVAAAQPALTLTFPNSAAGTLNDPNAPLTLTNPYSANVPDDAAFDCSTLYNLHMSYILGKQYPFCTAAQERSRLSFLGLCPLMNTACQNYMARIMIPSAPPAELIGAKDSGPGAPCQVPPCLTEPAKPLEAMAAVPAPQPGQEGFIGPLLPPGFYDKQDKKALAEARKEIGKDGVKDVVDLGGGNIAMMRDDGTVGMCDRSQCSKPVPAAEIKNPKVEAWVVENKGYAGVNQPVGFTAKANPGPGSKGTGGDTDKGTPPDTNPQAPPSEDTSGGTAYNSGAQLGRDIGALSGPSGPSSSGGGGFDSSSSGSGRSSDSAKPIPVSKAEVEAAVAKDYTFTGNIKAAGNIPGIAASANAAFTDGAKTGRVNVDSTMDASKHRGGIQASANSDEP